ncbi:sensor histidine kinase [Rubinisphaera margarita]|uniref:sensor histidine kinase n=1 Tax=Rubinisphaera margarita TaxID=2909586 RepID=UPI001EE8F541|nr:HAMP domain-containing sensor histidine kinase [Rubinisphaera margarita]MCG6158310.1 HAMP domain-containing histidine kinase [Rubinisphaera margarita]
MRWPLRLQILVPVVTIQVVTVLAVTISSAWIAVQRARDEVTDRLDSVVSTVRIAAYPLTTGVLAQLHDLSQAHFVIYDGQGRLRSSTLPGGAPDRLPALDRGKATVEGSVGSRSQIEFGTERYFVDVVTRPVGTELGDVLVLYPESRWEQAQNSAMAPSLAIGFLLLSVTVFASIWISHRIAARVRIVEKHVARIAGGNFEPLPPLPVKDELSELADSINMMASVLKLTMQRIRDNERAKMLTQLAGGMAHQFRNSLTGARVSLQLHQRHCAERNDPAIEMALKQLKLTEEQIKALLRLSRGEASPGVSTSLADVVQDVVSLVEPLCDHQKIRFESRLEQMTVQVPDGDAIRGSLLNIVLNATEATGPGGEVVLVTRRADEAIVIDIVDNGPGVPEDVIDEIFQPFFTTKKEGVGLGLALASQAVEDCGGHLEYDREAGRTRFRLTIPDSSTVEHTLGEDHAKAESSPNITRRDDV